MEKEADRPGWEKQKTKNNTTVWTRREKDETVSIMVEATFNVPPEIALNLLMEVELYIDCLPFTK